MKFTGTFSFFLFLFAISQQAQGGTGCAIAYEKADGFVKGQLVELTEIASQSTHDDRYVYKAWKGAMKNGLYMEISNLKTGQRIAAFSGPVEPGRNEILQFGDIWFTC